MDPHLKTLCAALAVLLSTIAFIPYVIETWKIKGSNEVRPTVSGWASWMLSDAAIFAAMIANHTISWQMVPYIFGPLVVIGLSLRKGLKLAHMRGEIVSWTDAFMDWSTKDTVCVSIVVAAVVAWGTKHDPDYAIYLTIFSTVIGTWAVARPLSKDPYRESHIAWGMFLAGGLLGVAAIPAWNITGALPPILFVGVQSTIFGLAMRRYLPRYAQAQL
jgi:hypothetical protein